MELTAENAWYQIKSYLELHIGMSRDMMHVVLGVLVFAVCALLLRRKSYGMVVALCVVAALQILNEVMDARDWIIWTGSVNWPETTKDTVLTLFLPLAFVVIHARYKRRSAS